MTTLDVSTEQAPCTAGLAARLRERIPADRVLTDPAQLRTYECDGLATFRVQPGVVVLAADRRDVVETVRLCAELGVPFVARGSGTGLSGGAMPVAEGVLIVLSRMRRIVSVDPDNFRVVVEPGVINLWVTREAAPHDQAYAPDPSSQSICSIGGNLAENAGGAHCLKYGFTVHHVMGAEVVLPDGQVVHLGGTAPEHPGYDLLGAFVGSEGTLGVATEVTVRVIRVPESVQTMLVGFASVEDAAAAVSDIIAAGILPAAIEMMDALAIEAAEATVHCGYPPGAVAVLIIELDGPQAEVDAQFAQVEQLVQARHAFETRIAQDGAERALMWKGTQVGVRRRGADQPGVLRPGRRHPPHPAARGAGRHRPAGGRGGVRVANVFHAGDGNLHPLILFDDEGPGAAHSAEELGFAILDLCIAAGGSITGEHGVGVEKRSKMTDQFAAADLDTMQLVRCAFDPDGLANPGKLFPTPRMCGERPGGIEERPDDVQRNVASRFGLARARASPARAGWRSAARRRPSRGRPAGSGRAGPRCSAGPPPPARLAEPPAAPAG